MSESATLQPLTIGQLQAFPLPKYLDSLPQKTLNEFSQLYDLIKGYIKGLEGYKIYNNTVISKLDDQVAQLNQIIVLLESYSATSKQIDENIKVVNQLYNEFINLETIQYQLLSSNFDVGFLKQKYAGLVRENDQKLLELVKGFSGKTADEDETALFLRQFRAERKKFHVRREKLHRWNEERVGGFV